MYGFTLTGSFSDVRRRMRGQHPFRHEGTRSAVFHAIKMATFGLLVPDLVCTCVFALTQIEEYTSPGHN